MLALQRTISNYINLKCGEVFYKTSADFNVVCCECSSNVVLEKFAEHFRLHFKLDEDEINLSDVEQKVTDELIKDAVLPSFIDPIKVPIKAEAEEQVAIVAKIPKLETKLKNPVKAKVGRKPKLKTASFVLNVKNAEQNANNISEEFKEEGEAFDFDDNNDLEEEEEEENEQHKTSESNKVINYIIAY